MLFRSSHKVAPGVVVERNGIARGKGSEFKPRLHLVEKSVRVVREMFFDQVTIGRLGVFHQRAAAAAIDIYFDIAAVEPRHAKCPQETVGNLLPLQAGVVAGTIAGLMNLVEGGRAQKFVIVVKNPFEWQRLPTGESNP